MANEKRIILFGGTTEGRELAMFMAERGLSCLVSVATEYGEHALLEHGLQEPTLEECESKECNHSERIAEESSLHGRKMHALDSCDVLEVRVQRLDKDEMVTLFREEQPVLVVDATHPYADIVSKNIQTACKESGSPYLRVRRNRLECEDALQDETASLLHCFATVDEMTSWINQNLGADDVIFSSLGSKNLKDLVQIKNYGKRVIVRILPTPEGMGEALALGYAMKNIYGLHGPFSEAFNAAQFVETGTKLLLTKDTGKTGGYDAKVSAALGLGIPVAVLSRPEDAGLSESLTLEEAFVHLKRMFCRNCGI